MAIDKYILLEQAIDIRDTNVKDKNSSTRIGQWCIDVLSFMAYINYPTGSDFDALSSLAKSIHDEDAVSQNTALRIGTFCFDVLEYAGIEYTKRIEYYSLRIRALRIKNEYKDGYNIRRLGIWFVDFLKYIDRIILLVTEDHNYYITTEDNYQIRLENGYSE